MDVPDESTHTVTVDDPSGEKGPLTILLMLKSVTSYFPVRPPTTQEWEEIPLWFVWWVHAYPSFMTMTTTLYERMAS